MVPSRYGPASHLPTCSAPTHPPPARPPQHRAECCARKTKDNVADAACATADLAAKDCSAWKTEVRPKKVKWALPALSLRVLLRRMWLQVIVFIMLPA